jgi:hypothetical protein
MAGCLAIAASQTKQPSSAVGSALSKLVFDFDHPFCLGHLLDSVEALAASWYSCTRNFHLDNLEARARISLDFCRIVGA